MMADCNDQTIQEPMQQPISQPNNAMNIDENDENTNTFPQCKPGFVDFYCFDAYEDPIKKPGQIWLFGKTLNKQRNGWQSICLAVKNIDRTMYVLPRLKNKADDIESGERIEFQQVYAELNEKRQRLNIQKIAAMPMDKKYAFRSRIDGIPSSAKYLKLCYSFKDPSLRKEFIQSGRTYEKIFGSRSTA